MPKRDWSFIHETPVATVAPQEELLESFSLEEEQPSVTPPPKRDWSFLRQEQPIQPPAPTQPVREELEPTPEPEQPKLDWAFLRPQQPTRVPQVPADQIIKPIIMEDRRFFTQAGQAFDIPVPEEAEPPELARMSYEQFGKLDRDKKVDYLRQFPDAPFGELGMTDARAIAIAGGTARGLFLSKLTPEDWKIAMEAHPGWATAGTVVSWMKVYPALRTAVGKLTGKITTPILQRLATGAAAGGAYGVAMTKSEGRTWGEAAKDGLITGSVMALFEGAELALRGAWKAFIQRKPGAAKLFNVKIKPGELKNVRLKLETGAALSGREKNIVDTAKEFDLFKREYLLSKEAIDIKQRGPFLETLLGKRGVVRPAAAPPPAEAPPAEEGIVARRALAEVQPAVAPPPVAPAVEGEKSLIQEATKYKSAEEFLHKGSLAKTPGTFWHGGQEGVTKLKVSSDGNLGEGVYLAESPRAAHYYAAGWRGGVDPSEFRAVTPEQIYQVRIKTQKLYSPTETEDIYNPIFINKIKELGYEGINTIDETIIFNPENVEIVGTFADIWNKTQPIATNQQKAAAHIIAKRIGFISEKGKPKPQYRQLAKAMTGKTSIGNMTGEEADTFIFALERLPEPTYRRGKLIPPSIPKKEELVTKDFFERKFRKPTPAKFGTSQFRYAELLGIKKLVEPYEIGKTNVDLEYGKGASQIDEVTKQLKKTKVAPKEMARFLNTSEEVPAQLEGKAKDTFNYFRDLTREVLIRENEVRATLGLPPIPHRQAYFRHIADKMSDEVIQGKYPLPEGLKFWSEQTMTKKVYNPMEMKRKLRDDLLKRFSDDLPYVMKSMLYTGLKEIHLSIPKSILQKELGVLSKDKAAYKNLTPRERAVYDAQQVMPAATKKWLLEYTNIVLGGRQTTLDESVNFWVTDSPLKNIINSALEPFGKHIGQRPITNMITAISKFPIYGTMGGVRPKQLIRNKFQITQNLALYGVKATLQGFLPSSSYPTLDKLLTDSLFKKSYSGFEDMPAQLRHKLERKGLAPYQWTAITNVNQAMKTSYHWISDYITNPDKKDFGWADPQRTYTEPKDFRYPSELDRTLKEMEYGAHTTQYGYIGMHMPEVFRYKALVGFTRLQSWWMNHWFIFQREAATRAFTGHTGYDTNLKVSRADRLNYLKYLVIGGSILSTLGYERSFLIGTAPTALPPPAQLMLGLYNYFTNLGETNFEKRKRSQAGYMIKNAALTFIPGYLMGKDIYTYLKGDKHWTEYLFYKKLGSEVRGVAPKYRPISAFK